jgi:Holliday junction resolvase RusA-like endonuclease
MTTNPQPVDCLEYLDRYPLPHTYKVGFTIPGVPVAKGRPKFSTRGGVPRAYTPAKTRTFEENAKAIATQAMGALKPCRSSVQMSLVVFVPIPASWPKGKRAQALAGLMHPTSRPDLDNYEKAITDALNGSQICDVVKSKRYAENPRVVLEFWSKDGFATYAPPKRGNRARGEPV